MAVRASPHTLHEQDPANATQGLDAASPEARQLNAGSGWCEGDGGTAEEAADGGLCYKGGGFVLKKVSLGQMENWCKRLVEAGTLPGQAHGIGAVEGKGGICERPRTEPGGFQRQEDRQVWVKAWSSRAEKWCQAGLDHKVTATCQSQAGRRGLTPVRKPSRTGPGMKVQEERGGVCKNYRLLYWADVGEPAKIEEAGMDGVGRRILVSIGIEKPTGLALDFIKNRLYWVDAGLHELFYSDLNGHYRRSVFDSKKYLTNPFALAVFENRVYWSDEESKTLYSADKFTGANVTVLAQNLTEPRGLVLFHKLMQPVVKNWCVEARAACEFLCVPAVDAAQHYACLCPDNMKPDETGHSCRMEMNWSMSQEEGEDSGTSQEEGDDSSTSKEEGEDSGTSQEEKSNRADLSYLDAVSIGIIAVIVFLTGTVMCCATVHWRMIFSRVKKSRCYSPVHLAAENSAMDNKWTTNEHHFPAPFVVKMKRDTSDCCK
ncbi:low-density lipoprotein receptor-like [Pristis pectinata]|uniref:low-density lipoprotein receptor-like n=1 Tax=Pristis pectinata TaxID=685728 RepID=UPI00223CE6CE|nr:low-density lipoprotein receptor-like [Pristis pectinata]